MRALRDRLAEWFGSTAAPRRVEPHATRFGRASPSTNADDSIPYRQIDDLLEPHSDILSRIKLSYGADGPAFERDLLPLIRHCAEHVHLLPATPDNFFSSQGGLLHLGLETAFFALQATDGQIFSGGSTITSRRELEPRWRLATFIAGLCHEVHRSFTRIVATDRYGEPWPAYLMPLEQWLRDRRADRFYIRWLPDGDEARGVGLFALPRIVPQPVLQHLAEGNSAVVPHMLASIAGLPVWHDDNVLDRLVQRAAALVIDRDLRTRAERSGKSPAGSHLGRHLVDAMRSLMRDSPAWQPNAEKSRVWLGTEGAFLVWPSAATDLAKVLEAEQLPGMPRTPQAMLGVLLAERIASPRTPAAPTWPVKPPGSRLPLDAVRLASPDILLAGMSNLPERLDRLLVSELLSPTEPPKPVERAHAAATPAPRSVEASQLSLDSAVVAEQRVEGVALRAPFKLDSVVASALADIVGTLDRNSDEAAAWMTPLGFFVPLAEFQRRQVDPGTAMRALTECDMLGCPGAKSKTIVMDSPTGKARGIVIAPRFIAGIDRLQAAAGLPTER